MMNLKNRSLPSWLKFAGTLLVTLPVFPLCAQTAPAATPPAKPALPQAAPAAPAAETAAQAADRSQAYYHVAMASIYEDDATAQGRPVWGEARPKSGPLSRVVLTDIIGLARSSRKAASSTRVGFTTMILR